MGAHHRRRKCLCCNDLFTADYRNRGRQRYCSKAPCKRARKKASQTAWLAKAANRDYFRGASSTERCRQWRARNPSYWKSSQKHRNQASRTQQDTCSAQIAGNQQLSPTLVASKQQDACFAQVPLFVGLISILTDSTQQDAIDQSTRQLHLLGTQILGRHAVVAEAPNPSPQTPTAIP